MGHVAVVRYVIPYTVYHLLNCAPNNLSLKQSKCAISYINSSIKFTVAEYACSKDTSPDWPCANEYRFLLLDGITH